MFCCFSFKPNPSLNPRDLEITQAFADVVANSIGRDHELEQHLAAKRADIIEMLAEKRYAVHYQPIWNFDEARPSTYECLARFDSAPPRSPDLWFADAAEVGQGTELELALILEALRPLPASTLPSDCHSTPLPKPSWTRVSRRCWQTSRSIG